LVCAVARAQVAPAPEALASLELNVKKTAAAWEALAKNLDARVARMLPCDARTKAAIDEASQASQARFAALSQYYELAESLASKRVDDAKRLFGREQARWADIAGEQAHAEESAAAVNQQLAELSQSASQQAALAPAQSALQETARVVAQRSSIANGLASRREAALAALSELSAAYEARYAALRDLLNSLESERARWNGYYAARLARSQTECSLTGGTAPAAKPAASRPAASKSKSPSKAKKGKTAQ
jgi:chromosome segregation ATPase